MITLISDVNFLSMMIKSHATRMFKMMRASTTAAKLAQESSISDAKQLHTMVTIVDDKQAAGAIDSDAPRVVEGTIARALGADELDELAVGGAEHLNAMVVPFGHEEQLRGGVDGQAARVVELAGFGAPGAEAVEESAVGGAEHLDAMVVPLTDVERVGVRVDGDAVGPLELALFGAHAADAAQKGALGGLEDLDAVVVVVSHEDGVVTGVVGQAARVVQLAFLGAAAAKLEEIAAVVEVEDLDSAVAVVGHEEAPAFAVDGHVSRVEKAPCFHAVAADGALEGALWQVEGELEPLHLQVHPVDGVAARSFRVADQRVGGDQQGDGRDQQLGHAAAAEGSGGGELGDAGARQ